MKRLLSLASASVFLVIVNATAYGQGPRSSLSGTVVDVSGGVIPGASIIVKNNATGSTFDAVTNDKGTFNIPALDAGTYTVTVALTGFKKAVIPDVKLNVGTPGAVKAVLEVGGLEETVVVQGGAEIVQTQSTTVSTTMTVNQISELPLVTRNPLDFVTFLPGVDTPVTNRSSTVNGLPQGAINITLDGINVQDNNSKTTDGFFAAIVPHLDAIEEVTVSTATPEAQGAGQGAVQINFVTRSGTNHPSGSVYHYLRNPNLNSNYWFNNRDLPPGPDGKAPRDQVKLNQYGFRVGGPIVVPKVFDGHDKAFFFFNYEAFQQPTQITRQRTILTPLTQQGVFQYNTTGGVRQVDVLALAAANGQTSTPDPVIAKLLVDIRDATTKTGGIQALTDPNLQRFTFTNSSATFNYYPTARVDVNLTDKHRLSATGNYQNFSSDPDILNSTDPSFPGFPNHGSQTSTRYEGVLSLRSTLTSNLVNEARFGYSSYTVAFRPETTIAQFKGTPVADQNGFNLSLSSALSSLTNPTASAAPSKRSPPDVELQDTLSWLKGAHSVSVGGTFNQIGSWSWNQTLVPTINLGVDASDPANAMFSAANFPGASATDLQNARGLYAILTGRVTAITGNAVLDEATNQYSYLGSRVNRAHMREFDLFAQDSWRIRKNLTVNYGLRYAVQLPFVALNDAYSTATVADVWGVSGIGNLFKPGTMTGTTPTFVQYTAGAKAFNTDWNNLGPSLGFAWRPSADRGWLGAFLGQDGETVVRGAFAVSYSRNGIGDLTGVFGNNPGTQISATRSTALGNIGPLPLLFRNASQLGPAPFAATPVYPMLGVATSSVNIFDPNLQVPYSQSWTLGVQRAITKNTAIEVRYVGTHNLEGWTTFDFNEANIVENGFLDEFKKALNNLQANVAAGRGNTFAYTGAGTSPLPIFLAYFNGVAAAQAGDTTKYTGTSWTNSTFLGYLARNNPLPYNFASASTSGSTPGLYGDATRRANALAAGLPANFFVVNPDLLGGANLTGNGGSTRYDALQIELRRRLSHGFLVQSSYTLGNKLTSARYSFRTPRELVQSTGSGGGIHHAFKTNWVYELPFGHNRRFASGVGNGLDRIIGGWEFDGTGRIQSGEILSFGNVRLVGMTDQELQNVFKIRKDDQNRIVYVLPQDIVDNTIKAFSVSATSPTGYSLGAPTGRYFAPANSADCIQVVTGDCAPTNHFVTGPVFVRFDLSAVKRIPITQRVKLELRGEFLNAFNNINFIPVTTIQSNNSPLQNFGQVTSAYRDQANTQDPGGRLVQLVSRISW